jgi:hypothetical protein
MEGYLLFKTLPSVGDIVNYLFYKYFPSIFRARVALKEWDLVRKNLSTPDTIWRAFEVYRTLNFEQQQELRSKLDDQTNLLAKFLIDSEGTEVDDWTYELINDWLNASTLRDQMILMIPASYRANVIRNLLYYSHGDGRFRRGIIGFKMLPSEMPAETFPPEPLDVILVSFRGSEQDFESLFLGVVREWVSNYVDVRGLDGVELLRGTYEFDGTFALNAKVELPFYQYPNLIEKYGDYIEFTDERLSSSDFERIFDLIDRKDHLQALRYLAERRRQEPGSFDDDWILATYGVRL